MSSKSWVKKIFLSLALILSILTSYFVYASGVNSRILSDSLTADAMVLDDTYLSSNAFTKEDDLSIVDNFLDIPSSYLLVGENDYYKLYMEEGSYAIRLYNKADGFIYGSSISTKDDNLEYFNTTWEGIVNSAVTIKYYSYNDTTGVYTSVEESFLKSSLSTSTYERVNNGFRAHLYFGESGISLDLLVYLTDSYLVVEIPNDSIEETGQYLLRSIKTYPFLGAVYSNSVPGYILVPDGSGALIRYQPIDVLTDIYEFRYYGQDNSIQAELNSEPTIAFPVSGMVLGINQHGFISIVEDGAAFASLVVSPAKNNLKYYYTYNEFLYRSLYQTPLSESDASAAGGRLVTEDNMNTCNVVLKYQFLTGEDANYVGMASAYQSYLLDSELVVDRVSDASKSGVFFEVIGSEKKEGFIFNEYLNMTDYSALKSILSKMDEEGIGVTVSYLGYTSSGTTSTPLSITSLSSKLGSLSELKDLISYASSKGMDLYLYTDPMTVYSDARFSIYQDIAKRVNQNLLTSEGLTKMMYFASPSVSSQSLLDSVQYLQKQEISMVSLGSIGNTLYSDYTNQSNVIDRSEAIKIYVDALSQSTDTTFLIYQSNLYTLKYSTSYLLTPSSSSRYRIYSDTVPFVPYVLSSVLDKYSSFQNFGSSSKYELLRMVDFGIYPSYIITEASAYLFQDTELKQIYSSSFSTWREKIVSDYLFVSAALDHVINASVVSRSYIDLGVYEILYSTGVKIIVNYSSRTIDLSDGIVLPSSYLVVIPDA
ncbi:MAG: DUF5696 domain-containing protein [Candidatus Izemoplasmatales bacterium]